MKILAIDGALGQFSVALCENSTPLALASISGKRALEDGLEAVAGCLREAHIQGPALDRLAVGVGPGGFTGLRIAISYAKALALGWNLSLVGLNSFDLLEAGLNPSNVLSVVSGRTGVISARYASPDGKARASGPISEVLDAVLPANLAGPLSLLGASEDVLTALAERGIPVTNLTPLFPHAATAAAYLAQTCVPEASSHAVRADYGEAPAAKLPAHR